MKIARCSLAALVCAVSPALANEYPRVGGLVSLRYAVSQSYASEDPRPDAFETFPGMIANVDVFVSPRLTFRSEVRAETIAPPFGDRVWEDVGLFVRSLYGEYAISDATTLTFGKFTPSFAIASLVTPGIFGNNYNKDYELIERVGFGLSHRFDAGSAGTVTVTGSTFFRDTSFLSDSLFSSRGQVDLEDGKAGNTEDFSSVALSLNVSDIPAARGLTLQFGVLHEGAGEGDIDDAQGFALAATQDIPLDRDRSLLLIGEVARFQNFEGTADDVDYLNAGVSYNSGPWNLVLSGTYRKRDQPGAALDDYSIQTHATYDFGDGWLLGIANEVSAFNEAKGNQLAFRLAYNIPLGGQ